ncbi:chromosomal replication initiator protein DnaA [Candidatus Woesebacteria bacterium RBG_16_36_11]|uniref:Chromosomal replication initiator protein DnaA n=3 Tax=Candidatus Woeseibacteriota TaxID=1752722 RepID=A0A1F7XB50_9BACT|nr:MAG: chromosomal replication initiator protein DnaA [Candidatus Woesebacteria bacterium RBG_13_36_22]OGM12250.1 MAG: chromosomal replication initiator protein DnaA [Candidatus Woesebacteria bacterium RBG_16_36_11]OGM16332.1 MAG: chromosomal replication initiator protein DnaA [Candidatus Woesebacteria bacterium RBG_19FT_COMBO_37_29]
MEGIDKKQVWLDFLENIKVSVSPAIFTTWFSQTHLTKLDKIDDKNIVEVGCPSPFVKTTIESRYYGLIQDSLSSILGNKCDLIFVVKANPNPKINNGSPSPLFEQGKEDTNLDSQIKNSRLRKNFTFANFAVSSSNQMAWAAADAVSQNPGTAYNPLFIWGGVGVGKTHLMNSVGYEILKKGSDKKVHLCTGEDFTNDIVEGIRKKTTQNFRNKYRKLDALLIDDIQFIAGKDAVQEEFFHTFNAIVAAGGQIILTSDKSPSDISKLEERLRSRFEAGLIVDIAPPDFELRCAIIQIKSKEKEIDLPMDLVQLAAGNLDSARKIEGFLVRLFSETKLKKIVISEDLIKSILGKNEAEKLDNKRTPDEILNAVCKHFSIGKRSILGQSRIRSFALPRQIHMYILRTSLGMPYEEIGRVVGDRDHTTVMHAVDKITTLVSNNVQIREDIEGIKSKV